MKLIYLEWEDAIANHSWHEENEMKEFAQELAIVKQVGWVYQEDDKYLVIYGRIDERNGEQNAYGNLQKIPKTWVRKRIDLTKHIRKT